MPEDLKDIKKKLDEINKIIKNYDPAIKEVAFDFLVQKVFVKSEKLTTGERIVALPKEKVEIKDKIHLPDLLDKIKPRRHTDKVLAFGYYLEKIKGMESFTTADIDKCYYDVRMERSNTTQMITQNIRKGFIMSAKGKIGAKQQFVITRKGEQYVENGLKLIEK